MEKRLLSRRTSIGLEQILNRNFSEIVHIWMWAWRKIQLNILNLTGDCAESIWSWHFALIPKLWVQNRAHNIIEGVKRFNSFTLSNFLFNKNDYKTIFDKDVLLLLCWIKNKFELVLVLHERSFLSKQIRNINTILIKILPFVPLSQETFFNSAQIIYLWKNTYSPTENDEWRKMLKLFLIYHVFTVKLALSTYFNLLFLTFSLYFSKTLLN